MQILKIALEIEMCNESGLGCAQSFHERFDMENAALAVQQVAKAHTVTGSGGVDPTTVAEFEKLMKEGALTASGLDQYQARAASPLTELGADIIRVGGELSRDFRLRSADVGHSLASLDASNPLESFNQMIRLQESAEINIFKLQFATGLAQSINSGFSTLFHLQG